MERDRKFSFKLVVPPRVGHGLVSAVRPQEVTDNGGAFLNPVQQGFTKCFNKEQNMDFSNKSTLTLAKPNRQAVSPMGNDENTGQLYTKLFEDIENIKLWKVKIDSDTAQKERKLAENKRTIETQRKAIQELQFANESLSIKLEDQMSENEELRNRNNTTRNMCNILKDTFKRSVEKMHLFECEREEAHVFLFNYQESIQKRIEDFQALHIKAEADQEELQKAKEGLLQTENRILKLQREYNMKEEDLKALKTKFGDTSNKLEHNLLSLQETKERCRVLQEEIDQKSDLLRSSSAERDSLLRKLQSEEQRCKETEEAMAALLAQSKEEYAKIIQMKELNLEELTKEKRQQTEKLGQMQVTVDQLQMSLAVETQKVKKLEDEVTANAQELGKTKNDLGNMIELSAKKDEQIEALKEQLNEASKSMEAINSRVAVNNGRAKKLAAELLIKTEEAQQLKAANANAETSLEELKAKSDFAQVQVEELRQHLINEKKKNEDQKSEMEQLQQDYIQLKSVYQTLLSDFNDLKSVKSALEQQLENKCTDVQTVEENIKMSEENALKLTKEMEKVKNESQLLQQEVDSMMNKFNEKCQEIENLKKNAEENSENLHGKIATKERRIKVIEAKNKVLKTQVEKETAKSSELQNTIASLQEENQSLKSTHTLEHQKLLEDYQNTSAVARDLELEVKTLRSETEAAIRNKEDAELKCQNKIADMVTLMEKHKNQYDRMVQEKDTELEAHKEKKMKAVEHEKSLKQELSKQKKDNELLKKELKEHIKEKTNLQKELLNLKNEKKKSLIAREDNKESSTTDYKKKKEVSKTTEESILKLYRFDFSKDVKKPSSTKDGWSAAEKTRTQASECASSFRTTPQSMGIHSENVNTTKSTGSRTKIKSYRILTPPSTEKNSGWVKGTIELNPKSDSSSDEDLMMFANTSAPISSASQYKDKLFNKSQSPFNNKPPTNNFKLAAMKRMREAGWTAVTGSDKKKKTNEKIFA